MSCIIIQYIVDYSVNVAKTVVEDASIWETRNNILQGADSFSNKAEEGELYHKLLQYQQRQNDLLHYGYRIHTSHPIGVIAS